MMDPPSKVDEASAAAKSTSNEAISESSLQRTPSTTSSSSATSSQRDNTRTIRAKRPTRQASVLKTPTSAALEDKSLTSFPSLSPPDDSPNRGNKVSGAHASLAKIAAEAAKTPTAKTKPELKQKRLIVAALTAKTPSSYGRHSLFEDSPTMATQNIPGALHYASDAHIESLIARIGAVKLVRQLAEDLAHREAEMSSLRQRSETRERELKKMLREVEVGNMDIEARLHALDQLPPAGKKSGMIRTSSIGEMMQEALGSGISKDDDTFVDSEPREEQDRQATIRARAIKDVDTASLASQDTSASKTTSRGWKDYLWSGTATKKSSRTQSIASVDEQATARQAGSGLRRKGLDETLFIPPETEQAALNDKPRATSVTSWTMKLFAGGTAPSRETTSRGRANTSIDPSTSPLQGKLPRAASQASVKTTESARTAPRQSDARNSRRTVPALNFGLNNAVKGSSASGSHVALSSPSTEYPPSNLGPVEMDAILPHGLRPPTLTPSYYNIDNPDDLLTDRFGFIYDQRRRKKEADALARMHDKGHSSKGSTSGPIDRVGSETHLDKSSPEHPSPTSEETDPTSTKKWQEYLKLPSKPTELLSHTPSSTSIITLSNPAIKQSLRRTLTFENIKENEYSSTPNPLPSTFTVTASKAEIASPLAALPETPITPAKSEFEPVKALLSQLTDLHDNLQRDKTVKWNEFFRKVRIERQREEENAAAENKNRTFPMPEANLADGETIGIATLGNKGKIGRAKYREFKTLVLSGIPVALRAKVWTECSGAAALRIPGYYSDLIASGEDDPTIVAQIQMDINRTLTDNVFFRRGPGVEKLNEVLLAYSRRNTEVGYCQGMNLITASLLLIMPTAEDAFWLLVSIIENILPRHYFDNSLLTSRADQQVLKQYVAELLPKLASHLESLNIDLEALTFQWFLSLFTACLNAEALYRVWDVLLCCKDEEGNGGSTFLFQVALALLKLNETQLISLETPGEVYAYLGGEITNHAISIDGLIKASEGLKSVVRRSDVEERRANYVYREQEEVKEREALDRGGTAKRDGQLDMQDPLPIED